MLSTMPCDKLEGQDEVGGGKEIQGGEIHVYLWLVHDDIWQKPTQDCKAIILKYRRGKKTFLKAIGCLGLLNMSGSFFLFGTLQ